MSEYWGPLQRLLAKDTAVDDPRVEIPRMLVQFQFVAPKNEQAVRELLAEHSDTYIEDPDDEHNYYCQCGKWLEWNQYDLPDHQAVVLDDAGLLLGDHGPRRPPPKAPDSPVPAAFQFPRRQVRLDLPTNPEETP